MNINFQSEYSLTDFNKIIVNIENINLGLANAIRRSILSEIPIIGFNDNWNNEKHLRNIVIEKNNTVVHNEFLAHRLSMIPICQSQSIHMKNMVTSHYDEKEKIRTFSMNPELAELRFKINISTSEEDKSYLNDKLEKRIEEIGKLIIGLEADNKVFIDVKETIEFLESQKDKYKITTDLIQVYKGDELIQSNDIFWKDSFTNDYPLIYYFTKIDNEEQEIDLEMKPTLNTGRYNSSYCPVGTVSMKFIEDDSQVNNVFIEKLKYKHQERVEKGLNVYISDLTLLDKLDDIITNPDSYSEFEDDINYIISEKKSFDLLDRERVYKMDSNGEPFEFQFIIESIGQFPSVQLLYDSIFILKLKLHDILNNISFNIGNFIINDKLEHTVNTELEWVLKVKNENHTIGNLVNDYLKSNKYVSFGGYKMPHPLKEEIEFYINLNKKKDMKDFYKTTLGTDAPEEYLDFSKNMTILIFFNTITEIIINIDELLLQIKQNPGLNEISPSFKYDEEDIKIDLFK